uniref:Sleeping Beauty transposase HTH domain-containing protein n=1 Tax=Oncorhynchus tshawytscha TaxID=74940 RepID=A0AAZ3ST63_ONCTS
MFLQLGSPPEINSNDWKGTPVCITFDSGSQSENQAMRSKELSVELQDRIVSRQRSGEGYKNIFAALNVPKNTVVSIIWKKSLPRAGRPTKQSNRGRRALVREVTKNPSLSDRAPEFLCGDGKTFHKDNHLRSTPPNQAFMVVARRKPLSKRHMAISKRAVKRHLKYSDHEKQDSLV